MQDVDPDFSRGHARRFTYMIATPGAIAVAHRQRPFSVALVASIAIILGALAGCAAPKPDAGALIAPVELTRAVSGTSLLIERSRDWPYQTLIYLDPVGTGWYDGRLASNVPPDTADMAMIIAWRVPSASRLCLWLSPYLGQLSSFVPPHQECLHIHRSPTIPGALEATITREESSVTTPVYQTTGNAFPEPRIAHYLERLRVFHGGHVPVWTIP